MTRSTKVLFCDNEHGTGDVSFPDIGKLDEHHFVFPLNQRELRKEAKKAGWSRVNGADYCDMCTEGGI